MSLYFRLRDSSTGLAKTGLTSASAGGVASYTRKSGSATAVTMSALGSVTAAWSSGGFIEVDATNAPGVYRLDFPDAAFASGVPYVIGSLKFTGVIEESTLVRLETVGTTAGAGAITTTVTVTNSVSSLPIEGVRVWVTTDSAGSNVTAGSLTTDSAGQVIFYLNAGTYYFWRSAANYTATNPTTAVIA